MKPIQKTLLALVLFFGMESALCLSVRAQGDIIVGNPPDGGLPGGEIILGGTQTTNVVPVHFQVLPVSLQLRVLTERSHGTATVVSGSEAHGNFLANLALGRAPGTMSGSGEVLALALGDDAPISHRLIVFNRATSTQTALIARGQREDIVQDAARKIGLLKFTFVAGGSTQFAIGAGTMQLASSVFSSRRSLSMTAGGNGSLDFTSQSVARRAVIASVNLEVAAAPAGSFVE